MPHFRYRARDAQGELLQGHMEANGTDAVADRLTSDGSIPLAIEEVRAPGPGLSLPSLERRVSITDLMVFSRQMYTLSRAGIPILRAMTGLAESTRHPRLVRVIRSMAE
ncbi:MAG: type II secretion system F family protein, partial [Ectothiorhodospiraceae bacterium]